VRRSISIFEQFQAQAGISFVAHGNVTPRRAKANIIRVLRAYFDDGSALTKAAVEFAPEAVNVRAIKRMKWSKDLLNLTFQLYRLSAKRNEPFCFDASRFWEYRIEKGMSSYWSGLSLARDLNALGLHDFTFETFRTIGHLIESVLQPHLKELLLQARITVGTYDPPESVVRLDLGLVVGELIENFGFRKYLAPWPWMVSLNQWRNIAHHFSMRVEGDLIVSIYGKGKAQREIRLTRSQLLSAVRRIHMTCRSIKTGRSLFLLNNIAKLGLDKNKIEIREEAKLFHVRSSLATQGFELLDMICNGDRVEATVREMTIGLSRKTRMIHASQFVCPIWTEYPHSTVIVHYLDFDGQLLLTAAAKGEDCKAVVDDGAPIETLAQKVNFSLTEPGKIAWRNSS
jgi:hypothetical protein